MIEVYFDFKKNGFFIALKVSLITLFFLLVALGSSFTQSTDEAINRSFSNKQVGNLYSLIDSLYDPEAFSQFRDSQESIDTVAGFYNRLNESSTFSFLSVFDQPVPVVNFQGDSSFDYGYDTDRGVKGPYKDELTQEMVQEVKALQMNQQTFDFYRLAVAQGEEIDWERVSYLTEKQTNIPVILGNDYLGLYTIGDRLIGYLYFEKFTFKVVGILEKNSSLFYKENMNKFLDNYLILPYPAHLGKTAPEKKSFAGMLNFAMINGDIVTKQTVTTESLLIELERIAMESRFSMYSLLSVPSYLVQFTLMRSMIQQNSRWLIVVIFLLSVGLLIVLFFINNYLFEKRWRAIDLRWKKGESVTKLSRYVLFLVWIEYLLSMALFLILYKRTEMFQFSFLQIFLICQLLGACVEYFLTREILKKRLIGGNLK